MIYAISDIHGCYRQYMELLEKIRFSEQDHLYILGDAVDRGPEPIRVLADIAERPNITFLLGNHDDRLLQNLSGGAVSRIQHALWLRDGGETTYRQFRSSPAPLQRKLLRFLSEANTVISVSVNDKTFLLSHAGVPCTAFSTAQKNPKSKEYLCLRTDYEQDACTAENAFQISGHTPTPLIRKDGLPLIYTAHRHIAIDCGCVFGGRLGAYCLNNGLEYYVE